MHVAQADAAFGHIGQGGVARLALPEFLRQHS
jgi:hypothetical protein